MGEQHAALPTYQPKIRVIDIPENGVEVHVYGNGVRVVSRADAKIVSAYHELQGPAPGSPVRSHGRIHVEAMTAGDRRFTPRWW